MKRLIFATVFLALFISASEAAERSFDWFWFFHEKGISAEKSHVVYRPFFLRNRTPGKIFDASLMPVIYWRYASAKKDDYRGALGFFSSINYRHNDKTYDYDLGIFPLLYYGSSPHKKDQYCMLWPFGGTIKGKLGQDKISPYLFPGVALFFLFPPAKIFSLKTTLYLFASLIPAYVKYSFKDYRAGGILWPLIQWGKSPVRDDFRILPFYAHNSKKGYYDNYSYLLLFNYREMYFSNDTRYTFFFLPLFGRKWSDSGRISSYTILWPFFSWGYDRRTGERQYNMPWPLIQIQDTMEPRIVKRIFFPFYGYYRFTRSETEFITPLYFTLKKKTVLYNSRYYVSFFIFWYFKRDYSNFHPYYGKSWTYVKLWPLFHLEYNESGKFSFFLFSFLPIRDREGYERLYQPFWTLFEYESFMNGEKRLGFLLRTWYQRWGRDFFQVSIPGIFSLHTRKGEVEKWSVLFSMFGGGKDERGKYLKLFWIPFYQDDEKVSSYLSDEEYRLTLHSLDREYYRSTQYGDVRITGPLF